jgi:DNA-binding GntR family transcriptional regulator
MQVPEYETKKDYIARQIKKRILDGEYAPGTRLKVRKLAAEFGSSEIPVREAIIQLTATGLVSIRPHVGAMATPISSQDLLEIFQIRSVLESLATELATDRMTVGDLKDIEEAARILRRAVEEGRESDELTQLNRQFHLAIYRCSGNERLVVMIADLWTHAGRYPAPLTGRDEATYQSLRDHEEILEALHKRDKERAKALTQSHKERSFARIVAQVRKLESLGWEQGALMEGE